VQAEIWRAASHSRFYARYFRGISGFLGSKSFLNFFKKRVLGPVFTLQSSFERAQRAVSVSPPQALHPYIFLKIFPVLPPDSQMTGQSDNQIAKAVWQPTHPSNHLGKDHRTRCPAPPKTKPPGDNKTPKVTKNQRQRKAPRRTSGLQWSG